MQIYILMLLVLFSSSFIINYFLKFDEEKKRIYILAINIFLIWLISILKSVSVGTDTQAYLKAYNLSATWEWFDFNQIYFEKGYTCFMQLFSKFGLPFHLFLFVIYTIIYSNLFIFLYKNSKMPCLSLTIFICYQFFVFNMSGLRQALAMSLCLLAFTIFCSRIKFKYIYTFFIILLASTFHASALSFYSIYLIKLFKIDKKWLIGFCILCFSLIISKPFLLSMLQKISGYSIGGGLPINGSFLLLCFISFFVIYIEQRSHMINFVEDTEQSRCLYMIFIAIIINILFCGSSVLRMASYFSIFIIIAFPNSLYKCDYVSRFWISAFSIIFFVSLFFHDVLLPNQLNIVPYKFFWQ